MADRGRYDGFISYSRDDAEMAEAVRHGFERLARPLLARRALSIALDATDFGAATDLPAQIRRHLDESDHLILLASPASAGSQWVAREVEHWLTTRGPERLLIAWIGGELTDSPTHGPIPPLPPPLLERFPDAPNWVDLTVGEAAALEDRAFRAAMTRLAAPLHGTTPVELDSEDLRVHRRNRRIQTTAIVLLGALALATTAGVVAATVNLREAQLQRRLAVDNAEMAAASEAIATDRAVVARSQALAATGLRLLDEEADVGVLLVLEGENEQLTFEAEDAILRAGAFLALGPSRLLTLPDGTENPFRLNAVGVSDGATTVVASRGNEYAGDVGATPDPRVFVWTGGSAGPAVHVFEPAISSNFDRITVSPNGLFAYGQAGQAVVAWDLTSGTEIFAGTGYLATAPGRTHVLVEVDGERRLYRTDTAELIVTSTGLGRGRGFPAGAFTPDGRFAVVATEDTVGLVDLAADRPFDLAPLDGGRVLDAGRDGIVLVGRGRELAMLGPDDVGGGVGLITVDEPMEAAVSDDGLRVATVEADGTFRLYDGTTGQPIGAWSVDELGVVLDEARVDLDSGSDGATLLGLSASTPSAFDRGRRIVFIDGATGADLFTTAGQSWEWVDGASLIRVSGGGANRFFQPWGTQVGPAHIEAWPSDDHSLFGYSELDGAWFSTTSGSRTSLAGAATVGDSSVAFDRDETHAVVAGDRGALVYPVGGAAVDGDPASPDDEGVTIVTTGGEVAVVHAAGGSQVVIEPGWDERLDASDSPAYALSPDAAVLAGTDGTGELRLWDTRTGDEMAAIDGPSGTADFGFYDLVFHSDGRLVAAQAAGFVSVWDVEARELIASFERVEFGASLDFHPDQPWLLATGMLWDLEEGRDIGPRYPDESTFSPDGHWIIADGVRYPVTAESLAELACTFTGRPLTASEATRYGIDEPTACRS